MDKQKLIDALTAADNRRPRTQQKAIGVSALGGCRRKVWHEIQGDVGKNPTQRLAAIMGTAIHAAIELAFAKDPNVLIEHRVEIDGLPPATIDFFDPTAGEVVDWKTIKMSGRDFFVSKQKRWQIQTYGYLLSRDGFTVNTVTLVGIPRDGTEDDIIIYSEPYDESVALEALAWLDDLRAATEPPAPERDAASFCSKYCPLFGEFCSGISKNVDGEAITDATATVAAKRYVELSAAIKALESERDGAKNALAGVAGVTIDGIKVSWSEMAGRQSPDLDAIRLLLGDNLPMKQGNPILRLNVK
jgi:hypothetical protein